MCGKCVLGIMLKSSFNIFESCSQKILALLGSVRASDPSNFLIGQKNSFSLSMFFVGFHYEASCVFKILNFK